MENTTEFIKLLTAGFSLIASIFTLVILFKKEKPNGEAKQKIHAKIGNNSGIVNQSINNYDYTDNKNYVNKTQIIYNTSPGKDTASGDTMFLIICAALAFPYTNVLEKYQWTLKAVMLLVQVIIVFCLYKNVRICLPSKSAVANTFFLISPVLLLILNEIPSLFGFNTIDFNDIVLGSTFEKIYKTLYLLITYLAFLVMSCAHISSLISPNVSNAKVKKFFEGVGRLWSLALFFQILALFLIAMPNILFSSNS